MARKKKTELNDNNLAIAYYRFSSHSQNEASIDQQRELAHEWADAHGFKIVREYEDAAISGTTDARPGFRLMLSEVAKIRPHTLVMWKTDRLGRDKYVLAMAKKTIRDAGCEIHLLAESIPTAGPEAVLIEGLMDSMAEYYSRQLSQNIQRGMDYNAEHALYNGHKLFGYGVDRSTKKYVVDEDTAPFVRRMFDEYAAGKSMQSIADELNAEGLRTTRGARFGVKTLNKMLKNRAYIGEYRHGDITVEGGMPVLVDEATFERVQRRFAQNRRLGRHPKGADAPDAPRYWLTGKLYCGECGRTMQGVSGTSATGRKYYYYYCAGQREKKCHMRKARKDDLEGMVLFALHNIVDDEENVTALALDAAEHYEREHDGAAYLEGLEAKRREVERSLANLVKVIEKGVLSDTVMQRLSDLEEQKSALNEAIEAENVRAALCEDRHSIQSYFEKFLHADVNDPEIRDRVFDYFVDKVYLYDDRLVVTMWFSEDDRQEITWRDWFSFDEYKADASPFAEGEAAEFDCFPFSSTIRKPPEMAAFLVFPAFHVRRNDACHNNRLRIIDNMRRLQYRRRRQATTRRSDIMANLTTEMKEFINDNLAWVSTISKDGHVDLGPKMSTFIIDDNHIGYHERTAGQTYRNLLDGSELVIAVANLEQRKGYRFRGNVTLHSDDAIYEEQVAVAESKGTKKPMTIPVLEITEIQDLTPGATAGKTIVKD